MNEPAGPRLSATLARFQPSRISQIFALAAQLKEAGNDIVDLSAGEPDFDTPEHVKQAGRRAIDAGLTKYTPIDGSSALKAAIGRKFKRDNGLDYGPEQIVASFGAKPLLFNALQALLDPGDEVIVPAPCWTSYPGMVALAGGRPVILPTTLEAGFKLAPEALAAALGPNTKCLILCSPSNPTGAAYDDRELQALTAVLRDHPRVWIVSDELYEHILFDGRRFASPAQVDGLLQDRTLTVNGLSKAYAMTGWRIGYAGGPAPLIAAIRQVLSQSSGGLCAISQAAAIEALDGPQDFLAERAEVYRRRRDRCVAALNQAPGLRARPPEGAFYLFVECRGLLGKRGTGGPPIESSSDFARHLLEDWGVAVVPGAAFEAEPYFRLSFAAAEAVLDEGLRRIAEACKALA
jgi:aspartate aminotransferase